MDFKRINLHIHSKYSDGKNTIKDIAKKSLNLGLKYIAITDHFTNSWKANIIPTLDSREKINAYLNDIHNCQTLLKEINKDLVILKGIEIDLESSKRYVLELIEPEKFDLILFEYLENLEGINYIESIINQWKSSFKEENKIPLFGLAHFDPSYFIHNGLERLIKFLKKNNIYFEFNTRYSDYYSRKNELFFQEIKANFIPVAIGCDSHSSRNLNNLEEPYEMIEYYQLEKNLVKLMGILKRF
ncbi:MAG: PHP domain-containing protein [Promethearchaeota archaeon]